MNSGPRPTLQILKYAAVALAVLNLILLFVFQYDLPGVDLPRPSLPKHSSGNADAPAGEDPSSPFSLLFEEETLTLNRKDEIDLLRGVTLSGPDGPVEGANISVTVLPGESATEKIAEYSAATEEGTITAQRPLTLVKYNGPIIRFPEELPTLSSPDAALEVLKQDEAFFAKNGFGKLITDDITAEYTLDEEDPTIAHFTFKVVNVFNDEAVEQVDMTLAAKPILKLTTDTVTLPRGNRFYPLNYIESALAPDGTSLDKNVSILENNVDRYTPGTYTVTYIIYAPDFDDSEPVNLTVIVE